MKQLRPKSRKSIAAQVLQRIEKCEPRVWRLSDFSDLSALAVCQALSRLTRRGVISRLSKGVYYYGCEGAFGMSVPNPALLQKLAKNASSLFPAGLAAANMLGLSTQNQVNMEISTSAGSLPRKLIGERASVRTRRPASWVGLRDEDAAVLEFLRSRGKTSDLEPLEMYQRLLTLLSEKGRFERLLTVCHSEPPRVRAMLGALGQALGKGKDALDALRRTLNPLSRFDFGDLAGLETAKMWQAKEVEK